MKYKIQNIILFGYHGLYDYEKSDGQKFYIDISYKINKKNLLITDNIKDFIDYTEICNLTEKVFKSKRYNLLEKLTYDIYNKIISKYPIINKLDVVISKEIKFQDNKNAKISFTYKK